MFPELYSPNEPVYFLGYFPDPHLSMWIRIQDAYLYVDLDPGPKHWYQVSSNVAALAAIFVRIMYIYVLKVFIDVDYHQRDLVFFLNHAIVLSC